jgi:hypothetical protein
MVGTREGHRLLSAPLVRHSHGAPPYIPTLKRQRSRLSRECVTATGSMGSRSIRSSRRRAVRERWSSSTLGTLLLHRFVFIMAPPERERPQRKPGTAPPISRRSPKVCEPLHTAGDLFCERAGRPALAPDVTTCRGARHQRGRVDRHDLASHAPIEQVTDRGEPLPHARRGEAACRPSTHLGRPDRRARRQDVFQR